MQLSPPQRTIIINPIPQENLENFNTEFFEENATQLNEITILLSNNHLTNEPMAYNLYTNEK